MNRRVIKTINNFKKDKPEKIEYQYLNGDCYAFAAALAKKFHGIIYYLPIDVHFVTKIGDDFYDIRGLLNSESLMPRFMWIEYQVIEPVASNRIKHYCIDGKENLIL